MLHKGHGVLQVRLVPGPKVRVEEAKTPTGGMKIEGGPTEKATLRGLFCCSNRARQKVKGPTKP